MLPPANNNSRHRPARSPLPGHRAKNVRRDDDRIRRLAKKRMVSAELEDFLRYLHSPWNIIWRNLLVGLARGLGAVFGATVVVGLAIWVLKMFIVLPWVGKYARDFREKVSEMAEETRYSDDFRRAQRTLELIDRRMEQHNELLQKLIEQRAAEPDK